MQFGLYTYIPLHGLAFSAGSFGHVGRELFSSMIIVSYYGRRGKLVVGMMSGGSTVAWPHLAPVLGVGVFLAHLGTRVDH